MQEKNRIGTETMFGIGTLFFSVVGLFLSTLSYSTGYYKFGQNNSFVVVVLLLVAIAVECVSIAFNRTEVSKLWQRVLTFGVTICLAASAMLILADRVEGIGNCVVTDYDAGHGGEEAIYVSIGALIIILIGMIYNIIGSFVGNKGAADDVKKVQKKFICILCSILVIFVAVFSVSISMGGFLGQAEGESADGATAENATEYKVVYCQDNGNAQDVLSTQFLCGNVRGLVKGDARFFIDMSLVLADDGTYKLKSEAYVMEAGKRCEVGDDTGLGLVMVTEASGTYTDNGDGTITTAAADDVTVQLETDTYSSQIKEAMGIKIGDSSEDGTYNSADVPDILSYVPETVWTLGDDGSIVTYMNENVETEEEAAAEQ